MSNELSNLDSLSSDKIMAMVGQDADTGGSSLPRHLLTTKPKIVTATL